MKQLWWVFKKAFWGAFWAVMLFIAVLFGTLWFGYYGVFMWLWTTTGSVWKIPVAGAILGLSFGLDSRNKIHYKLKSSLEGNSGFSWTRLNRSLSKAPVLVKSKESRIWKNLTTMR